MTRIRYTSINDTRPSCSDGGERRLVIMAAAGCQHIKPAETG